MAKKFYFSTLIHHCPKCKTVLKKEKRDDLWDFICFWAFIPVGLIALIVHLIKKKTGKIEFNKYGEQIICCPNCQSIVAIHSDRGLMGQSRIIIQEKELFEMVKPLIDFLDTECGIICDRYVIEEKYSEKLGLRFGNDNNVKCDVFILNIGNQLEMRIGEKDDFEPFDMRKLGLEIIDILMVSNVPAETPVPAQAVSGADEILKYKDLMDAGIITEEEFNAKKAQILGL